MEIQEVIESVGKWIDVVGVGAIVIGTLTATIIAVSRSYRRRSDVYTAYRQDVGRAILIGLEFLVAADIIRTVAITPTFTSVGVLALIVLVRTFLSFTLELEITGRWPWQKAPESRKNDGSTTSPPTSTTTSP